MVARKRQEVVSILMDSPLYSTLSVEERQALLERLETAYPRLFGHRESSEDDIVGYEASWLGMP